MNRPDRDTVGALSVDVTTTAGSFTVVARFEAHPGITVLFGPSGSGKSLTLATIAGFLRPREGRISLHGELVADASTDLHVSTQERRIGMVAQYAALLPHRSPLDNVALAIRDPSRAARREQARQWLGEVGAEQLVDATTAHLSGGEQQRVALARALAGKPQLLLLDEPFSALDQPTRVRLRQLLRRIVDDHRIAAVVVTHDLDDAASLADRVVLYQPGHTTTQHDTTPDTPGQLARILGLTP